MATVTVINGNVDKALINLRKQNAKDGSSKKIKDRAQGYIKPGARKRIERDENIKNCRKRNKENNRYQRA